MKNLLLGLSLLFTVINVFGQKDSKKEYFISQINSKKDDTLKVLTIDSLVQVLGDEFEYDLAYTYAKKGVQLSKQLHFKRGEAIHLINCAGVLVRKQNQTKALELLFKAYSITQESGYLVEENKCLVGIAFAYTSFNDYQEAIHYKVKQVQLQEGLLKNTAYRQAHPENLNKDSLNYALSIATISFYNIKLNNPKMAFKYGYLGYKETLRISEKDPAYLAYPLNCIGMAHRLSNNSDSALYYYRASVVQSERSKSEKKRVTNLYKSYWEMALVFEGIYEMDSTVHYARKAETYCKQLKWDKDLVDIQLLLARSLSHVDPDQSIAYYAHAVTLRDSIYNKEKEEHLDNITFNEHERQAELEEMKRQEAINRRDRIQYSLIALGIFIFVLMIMVFSKRFRTSDKTNAFLTTLALLMVFEFLNLVAGPYLDLITADYPALSFTSAIVCSFLLFPFEARFEGWLVKHVGRKGSVEK